MNHNLDICNYFCLYRINTFSLLFYDTNIKGRTFLVCLFIRYFTLNAFQLLFLEPDLNTFYFCINIFIILGKNGDKC